MSTAWYRLTTKEVGKISLSNQDFFALGMDPAYYGVLTNPTLTNGSETVDANGNLRILGISKFAVVGTNTIRNATQPEIDTFSAGETTDTNLLDAARVIVLFESDPQFRKAFKAVIKQALDEFNILRAAIQRPIVSITRSGTVGTVTTDGNHGLTTGDTVKISGADLAAYNIQAVVTVVNATSFTYPGVAGNPATPAVGSKYYSMGNIGGMNPRTQAQALSALSGKVSAND